jgi:hypothetical protein
MSDFWTGLIWGLAILNFLTGIAVFVWKDIFKAATFQGWRRKFLVSTALIYSCNLPLFVACFGISFLVRGNGASLATPGEYKVALVIAGTSSFAIAMSIATMLMALFSAPGLARRLCMLGSSVALLCWCAVNVATMNPLAIYEIRHACIGANCFQ